MPTREDASGAMTDASSMGATSGRAELSVKYGPRSAEVRGGACAFGGGEEIAAGESRAVFIGWAERSEAYGLLPLPSGERAASAASRVRGSVLRRPTPTLMK